MDACCHTRQNITFLMIPLFAISRAREGALRELCDYLKVPYVPFAESIATCAGAYTELARELSIQVLFAASLQN